MDLSVEVQRALPLPERAAQIGTLEDQPHRAADLMTPQPITLPTTTLVAQAAAVMADRKLKLLPVVDNQGRIVGMVSRYDLLKTVAEGLRQRPADVAQLPAGAPATVGEVMYRARCRPFMPIRRWPKPSTDCSKQKSAGWWSTMRITSLASSLTAT